MVENFVYSKVKSIYEDLLPKGLAIAEDSLQKDVPIMTNSIQKFAKDSKLEIQRFSENATEVHKLLEMESKKQHLKEFFFALRAISYGGTQTFFPDHF